MTALGTALTMRPLPVARDGLQDLKRVLPRKALVAWTSDVGLLVFGVQTFTWGTGMLVNDGAGDPTFGDAWQGNVVARLLFATRPFDEAGSLNSHTKTAWPLGATGWLQIETAWPATLPYTPTTTLDGSSSSTCCRG